MEICYLIFRQSLDSRYPNEKRNFVKDIICAERMLDTYIYHNYGCCNLRSVIPSQTTTKKFQEEPEFGPTPDM
jgi:hypothetical protein